MKSNLNVSATERQLNKKLFAQLDNMVNLGFEILEKKSVINLLDSSKVNQKKVPKKLQSPRNPKNLYGCSSQNIKNDAIRFLLSTRPSPLAYAQ